jgi:two-component system, chemotaxis family, response regulator Rcp1
VAEQRRPEPKRHILVVEDNAADVELLRMALGHAGLEYDLTWISDGAEALAFMQQARDSSSSPIPDLAVLDLNLPKYGGIEILLAMRANQALAEVPVAVLTSSSWARERVQMQSIGIACYITKPADLDEYLNIGFVIRDILANKGGREMSSGV